MRMTERHQILPKHLFAAIRRVQPQIQVSRAVVESAALDVAGVYARLATRPDGLTSQEAAGRLAKRGPNVLAKDQRAGIGKLLKHAAINPLVILLAVLATISFATGDARAGIVMSLMILLGVGLKLIQEAKADSAAAKLKAMISVSATVIRDGTPREVAVSQLVPGDVVKLAAGDMIPGDVRLVEAKDLFVTQGSLTGESIPVEKFEFEKGPGTTSPIELTSIAFLGTSVESGSATAVVVATGGETFLGGMGESLSEQPTHTAFDRPYKRTPYTHTSGGPTSRRAPRARTFAGRTAFDRLSGATRSKLKRTVRGHQTLPVDLTSINGRKVRMRHDRSHQPGGRTKTGLNR